MLLKIVFFTSVKPTFIVSYICKSRNGEHLYVLQDYQFKSLNLYYLVTFVQLPTMVVAHFRLFIRRPSIYIFVYCRQI